MGKGKKQVCWIKRRTLGEWAIDYYLNQSGPYEDGILEDIAIACLGKRAITKKIACY